MDRRDFLKGTSVAGGLGLLPSAKLLADSADSHSTHSQGAFSSFVKALQEVEAEYVSAARGLSRPPMQVRSLPVITTRQKPLLPYSRKSKRL